ncbi:MAG: hypothetical protein ABSG04_17310 [Verrucomicrobiota bacterium]
MNPHLTLALSPPIRLRQGYGGTSRMGAEREEQTDRYCSTEVCRAAAGSGERL